LNHAIDCRIQSRGQAGFSAHQPLINAFKASRN
jgi:hypothetical protein